MNHNVLKPQTYENVFRDLRGKIFGFYKINRLSIFVKKNRRKLNYENCRFN